MYDNVEPLMKAFNTTNVFNSEGNVRLYNNLTNLCNSITTNCGRLNIYIHEHDRN